MPLTIWSPSPAPPRLAFCACQNRSNTWGISSAAIPAPVSSTQNRTSPSREAAPTVIRPPALRELDRVADQVLEHLEDPVAISPDIGNARVHIELETRGMPKQREGLWASTESRTICSAGTRACSTERWPPSMRVTSRISWMRRFIRVAARWITSTGFRDRRFWFRSAALKYTRLHRDGTERIAKVMSDEPEHLIPDLGRLDRRIVETGILDGDGRSLRQRLGQTKIALPVRARPGGGDEREHAEELSTA